ncbi:hypothetical protein AGABI1DRAFT_121991 [Agaricus bisporus var. burnettii JB137-S8]|uniref:Protein kinase domain-containing protein n=1 Tax=Agaricus bisporus var. burnettii (strain JB137-S8 / ATCC MYA-4627 / FGSC 10392) TaxID=597362 RepID=K5WQL5_AGABU|nr:uncharacterized protein AGABI1DRAFT_121991 [Agaricus bisporus var. burnettii JB137-S8]EKM77616.1 hypothetical protein AGABI1DRAFT_121991 [Agaricus bisporus var. burnettii JB137-S8]
MSSSHGHRTSGSVSQNHRAQLANAYNELGRELSSSKIRVVGNYTLGKVIGEGTYGKVRMGTHRLTSTRVAIKQIPKAMSATLTREIHHHRQLHHPHVAQMFEVIATESSIWIVTELCCGGELFDYLLEKGRLTEDETRILFGQLCLAVAYLHESGIVHRDLKLENVLLDEHCRVKLGDFGFAREYDRNNFMQTFCGTTGYASPEMLEGKKYQGPEVDVWSLGIILYCLLTGTLPFDDDDEAVMRAKVIQGDYEDPLWLSLEARDLIKQILQRDVTKRITIPQIFLHPWFSSRKQSFECASPLSADLSGPSHPVRTPARTKRRSISSTLSDNSDTQARGISPLPILQTRDLDFTSLLTQPTPIIFSTPLERKLLNMLSSSGFDTGQVVHSVLTDACDSAGAVWWMLKKKAEKKALEDSEPPPTATSLETPKAADFLDRRSKRCVAVQTESEVQLPLARSAPQLAFVPATPTTIRAKTPPRRTSPTRSPMLSPSSSSATGEISSSRSHPSTPGGSLRDREKDKRKPRSGSVSIMQRATTALEAAAAGLVRKKSAEGVKEREERERDKSRDEARSSHGSASSRLTKSPPLKAKEKGLPLLPVTPPPSELHTSTQMGSPWVLAESRGSPHPKASGVQRVPAMVNQIHSQSAPNITEVTPGKQTGQLRPRGNLLTAFRLWFHEDRKGKRKENSHNNGGNYGRPVGTMGTAKRRGSGNKGKFRNGRTGHRGHRPSVSSRRSSSVNSRSRRSSVTSMQMVIMDSPQLTSRRSFGAHTPNSERGEYPSRPSSIQSFSMQPRHRRSPSASSAGSAHFRTASPMQARYHRRAGSGSSTRVIRQVHPHRGLHARSNSAASSIHSPVSSRPTSFYEPPSESELARTGSPFKTRRRPSGDKLATAGTVFIQKRGGTFASPVNPYSGSLGRSGWKKAWGLEPPGWQTRTAHLPVEVLAISPVNETTMIRDVFSGRQSLNLGDESDWVDEEDDIPAFAGGLGQMGASASNLPANHYGTVETTPIVAPPSRGNHRNAKLWSEPYDPYLPRNGSSSAGGQGGQGTAKTAAIQAQIDDTVGIMRENITKVAERGERLDSLQDKTDNLAVSAQGFRRGANRVRKNMWWKDMKMRIIIGVAIAVIIVIIVVSVVKATK